MKYGILRLTFIEVSILNNLEAHKKYIDKIEDIINQEISEMDRNLNDSIPDYVDEETGQVGFFQSQDYLNFKYLFPTIKRKSELISIYTILEYELSVICSIYEQNLDGIKKIQNVKSNGIIDKYRKYLEENVRIEFPKDHQSWLEIQKIQQIRNKFVNNNGFFKKNNNQLMEYIKANGFLSYDNNYRINIHHGYSKHCLEVFIDFFNQLFESMTIVK